MPFYESVLRPLLFLMEPERAHNLGLWAVSHGLVSAKAPDRALAKSVFGVRFPNPVGLAAGFDKNAVALSRWKDLGFGFVEVGTVTQHAQPGNPRPRMFRLPGSRAIINRLGFSNLGADAVAGNMEGVSAGIPVGVNIGKSKVTPLSESADDYAYSFRLLREFADYVVVNVSSPNTLGLRELQERDSLTRILSGLKEIDERKPLFVKIAPDLSLGAIEDVVSVCQEMRLTGMVCTNTFALRGKVEVEPESWGGLAGGSSPRDEALDFVRSIATSLPPIEGGLSGAPLTSMADETLRFVRELSPELVLIGVGGVMTPEDAKRKLSLGADLVQVYTGWVYGGPGFVPEVLRAL